MGVPAFYKWLVNKYPRIVVQAKQDKGNSIDIDVTSPNPNAMEFDNLYLDMNGIIHPCFHPDADLTFSPTTFEDVFISIYAYIDHIFSIVRPRNLLYLAIDGVAPRAKINQQRSRRFRTAKDTEIAEAEEELLRQEFQRQGKQVLPKQDSQVSDSNVITPGTEFMFLLSTKLQDYVSSRISCNPGWKNIKVILSDANVPGEGEHKIMSFIRHQRTLPDYNPNTRHCLYGLDADLIILALATHELYFSILREEVLTVPQPESMSSSDLQTSLDRVTQHSWFSRKPHQFLHVWILREYLEIEMQISDPPHEKFIFDIERIIDDFIFICFFVGNDFLPYMPTLQIHEKAIDLLMTVYKRKFKNLGGYLVDMQQVNDQKLGYCKLKRVEKFIHHIGTYEEIIFKKRSELYQQRLRKLCTQSDALEEEASELVGNVELDTFNSSFASLDENAHISQDLILQNTKELKEKLKARLQEKYDLSGNKGFGTDNLKLGTADWKRRYYKEKFSVENSSDFESTREEIVQSTLKACYGCFYIIFQRSLHGLDMKGLAQVKVKFQKGSPFKPFDQLMAVLPPRSSQFLPKAYQKLMTDVNSNIVDFYPDEFDVDTDGKRYMWQGICKLPFIDEKLLLDETREVETTIEMDEAQRNVENVDKILMRRSMISDSILLPLVSNLVSGTPKYMNLKNGLSGIGGFVGLSRENIVDVDFTFESLWNYIMARDVLILVFELQKGSQHIPRLLEGVEFPEKSIYENDIKETQLWHECPTGRFTTRTRLQDHKCHKNALDSSAYNRHGESHKGASTGRGVGPGAGTLSSNNVPHSSLTGVTIAVPSWNRNTNQNSNWAKGAHSVFQQQTAADNNIWRSRSGMPNKITYSWRPIQQSEAQHIVHGKGRGK